MRRGIRLLAAASVVVASAGAGVGAYVWAHGSVSPLPQISAYADGHTARIGPYFFCSVVDLNDCAKDGTQGTLRVKDDEPVQLSVPGLIGHAPWRLLKVHEDERDATTTAFRPNTHLAVTIPTVDKQRGKLVGFAVQLMTLVRDQNGDVFDLPHAEWSVKLTRE